MKTFYTLCGALLVFAQLSFAQVQVTFSVDLTDGTASADGIFITGSWVSEAGFGDDWPEPGSNTDVQMTDTDGDSIYSVVVTLPPGTYQYKYANGKSWANSEAGGGSDNFQADLSGCGGTDNGFGGFNRNVTVPADVSTYAPATYQFNSCTVSTVTSISDAISTLSDIEIYPNPVQGRAVIELINPTQAAHSLRIYNSMGKTILQQEGLRNSVDLNANQLSTGIYFVALENEFGEVMTKKFMVQ